MKPVKSRIAFKTVLSIEILLFIFSIVILTIGCVNFSSAMVDQYTEGAFQTAWDASYGVDGDRIEEYLESGGEGEEYEKVYNRLEHTCNSTGATFVYLILPDPDYRHVRFIFSTINQDSDFEHYSFGYVRETTNEEYREAYRRIMEGKSEEELVMRIYGQIATEPHFTALVPVKDSKGQPRAILCVQRQMNVMSRALRGFIFKVIIALLITGVLASFCFTMYLNRALLGPLQQIMDEASRFAKENVRRSGKLRDQILNTDEIGTMAESLDLMEEQIESYVSHLTRVTAERERVNTEIELAARIQEAMLPGTFPAFPQRTDFDVYASMEPARGIGGDFYNFFLIDDDHLCLFIGDVSGKGIPAALFMMTSFMILCENARMGKNPSEILETANKGIREHNEEDMFVTVWLGILELSSGHLIATNAGHEYPALYTPGKGFELYKDRHGFVLGAADGSRFKDYELTLTPGSRFFVYTDGVPEATDSGNQMFTTDRMIEALNEKGSGSPREILESVRSSVALFVGDAVQFDDLTMMCLSYNGGASLKKDDPEEE